MDTSLIFEYLAFKVEPSKFDVTKTSALPAKTA